MKYIILLILLSIIFIDNQSIKKAIKDIPEVVQAPNFNYINCLDRAITDAECYNCEIKFKPISEWSKEAEMWNIELEYDYLSHLITKEAFIVMPSDGNVVFFLELNENHIITIDLNGIDTMNEEIYYYWDGDY